MFNQQVNTVNIIYAFGHFSRSATEAEIFQLATRRLQRAQTFTLVTNYSLNKNFTIADQGW